ncbi:transmembrane amino acid transporter protein [Helicosporidium sp. ATCC 50920]|nr:transmembrane amino acid transporter protein [Helicosporidium sp. ATCC 50920]|eukprot:KDD75855.1 transmembrane amino acid transporter protein [Helicosporidium sp. ATCC 50920]
MALLLSREGCRAKRCLWLVNIFVGVGLLSLPYGVRTGGWLSLLILAMVLMLFCLSGQLIIKSLDYMGDRPKSYPQLGIAAVGCHGSKVVGGVALTELFSGSCVILLVVWQQLELLLPASPWPNVSSLQFSVICSLVFFLPSLAISNFKRLSSLSVLGTLSSALVTLAVLGLLPLDPGRRSLPQPPPAHQLVHWSLAQSVGIFAMATAAHNTLPAMRAAMAKPQRFPAVLSTAFGIMALLYAAVGGIGYWYYGVQASPLVTTDIATKGAYRASALPVDTLLAGLVLINCASKYPAILLVMQDLTLGLRGRSAARKPRKAALFLLRLSMFVAGGALAYTAANVLGNFISLVGGLCSMFSSVLMPIGFFSILAWRDLRRCSRAGLVSLLFFGVCLVVSVTYQNVLRLVHPAASAENGGAGGIWGYGAAGLLA